MVCLKEVYRVTNDLGVRWDFQRTSIELGRIQGLRDFLNEIYRVRRDFGVRDGWFLKEIYRLR